MISQSVIYSVLIGIVLTGVIPLIGGIALLAAKKIKGTSFWAGVLAFFIAGIATGIVTGIFTFSSALSTSMGGSEIATELPDWQKVLISILSAVILGFAMLILIKNCMKTRTLKAAISAGLGFGIPQLLTIALSFIVMYSTFAQINSGAFDQMYAMYVDMGAMTKETIAEMKAIYTEYTVNDVIAQILATAGNVLLMLASAIIIMIFVTRKKAMAGTLMVIGGMGVTSVITSIISNTLVAGVIALAIGAAAFIFAYRMKDKIVAPEQPTAANDAFMQSIASAKEEN